MAYRRFPDPKAGGFFSIMTVEDFEFQNPVEETKKMFIEHSVNFERNILLLKRPPFPMHLFDKLLYRRAEEKWLEEYNKISSTKIPDSLLKLLESSSKREQEKLLKGISLTTDELMSFIFFAWEKFGFTYSKYHSEHLHKGAHKEKLPILIHKDEKDGGITHFGKTELKDGQMRQIIEQRSVKVSKFLDRKETWHCFFLTYNSIGGDEIGSKPHIHYISNYWGLTRDYVLAQLQSKNYKLPSLPHIDYHTHRNPRK
jgi:hypothetical protein